MAKSKNITTMQLALMTAAAVISLRGLPMMAQEELTMFFYIFFATFLFLIPAALVGAELGSAFASRGGGVYSWVKEAFNPHLGFTAIFLPVDSERGVVPHRTGICRRIHRVHDRGTRPCAKRRFRRTLLDHYVLVRHMGDAQGHIDRLRNHEQGLYHRNRTARRGHHRAGLDLGIGR